jgi:hypothetical protein
LNLTTISSLSCAIVDAHIRSMDEAIIMLEAYSVFDFVYENSLRGVSFFLETWVDSMEKRRLSMSLFVSVVGIYL